MTKRVKILISLLIIVFGAHFFCDFLQGDFDPGNKKWWYFRKAFFSLEVTNAMYLLRLFAPDKRWEIVFFILTGIMFTVVTDNLSRIYHYTWLDIPIVLLTLLLTYLKYVRKPNTTI